MYKWYDEARQCKRRLYNVSTPIKMEMAKSMISTESGIITAALFVLGSLLAINVLDGNGVANAYPKKEKDMAMV